MAYVKQEWKNLPNQTTPVNATRMNHIEDGIYDNSVAISSIIESGSNSSGSWIKYSDGSMICYATVERVINFNTSSGSLYTGTMNNSITFPQQFVTLPRVVINTQNDTDYYYCVVYGVLRNKTSITSVTFLRTTSPGAAVPINFAYIAIGRWK